MCRNIKTLHNFEPPATDDEVRAAALQYVRKVSGSTKPSKANEAAVARAVDEIAHVTQHLLAELVTTRSAARPRGRGGARPSSSREALRPRCLGAERHGAALARSPVDAGSGLGRPCRYGFSWEDGASRCSRWSRSRCSFRQRSSASRPTLTARPCRSEAHFSRSARSRCSAGLAPRRVLLGSVAACVALAFGLGIAAVVGLVPAVPDPRGHGCVGGARDRPRLLRRPLLAGSPFPPAHAAECGSLRRARRRLACGRTAVALLLDDGSLGSLLGYAFEIVGIAVIGFIVARDLHRGAARAKLLFGDAAGADLVVDAEAFVGPHVRALLAELADEAGVHRGSHAPRRPPRGAGRRRARSLARPASRPCDRRPPARHRQARGAGRDPHEARAAHRRRVPGRHAARPHGARTAARARRLLAAWCIASSAGITSASTAPATRKRSRAIRSRSTSRSSPSATSTTRSSRSACTGRRGRTSVHSSISAQGREAVRRDVRRGARRRARARAPLRSRRRGLARDEV